MALPTVLVASGLRAALQQGHPWVYRNHVLASRGAQCVPAWPSGTWVRVVCGSFRGVGLWEAEGAIAVRLFSVRGVPDRRWVAERVQAAWDLRAPLRAEGGTTALRWVYGESDGLPGIVVDLYGEYAVVHLYGAGASALLDDLLAALAATAPLRGILLRRDRQDLVSRDAEEGSPKDPPAPRRQPPETVWGQSPPRELVVQERGLCFAVDLAAGQKTGLFLDQRENRATLAQWCSGKTVLDCFCYTGAFGLYAMRGGAQRVTCVDAAAPSLRQAERNFAVNGHDPAQHEFIVADAFAWLETCAASDRRFDVVVLDPPSLAHAKAHRQAALRAYTRLNRAALGCLAVGGTLASASCTSQVSPELFREALAVAAAQAGRRLTILHEAGQPLDHPVPAHFPEARYLKFVLARAGEIV